MLGRRFCSKARLVSWKQFLRALTSKCLMVLFSRNRCFRCRIPDRCWWVTSCKTFCLQSSVSNLGASLLGKTFSWLPASSSEVRLGKRRPPSMDETLLAETESDVRFLSWAMSRFRRARIWLWSRLRWSSTLGRSWGTRVRRFPDSWRVLSDCRDAKNKEDREGIRLLVMLSRFSCGSRGAPLTVSMRFPSRYKHSSFTRAERVLARRMLIMLLWRSSTRKWWSPSRATPCRA